MENQMHQPKKSIWQNASPKLTFFLGLISGFAVFAFLILVLIFTYSFVLTKSNLVAKLTNTEPAKTAEENLPPSQPGPEQPAGTQVGSFIDTGWPLCKKDGKPIVRLFSTTWCIHCQWIKETFDKVANEYIKKGKIVAYHWELDQGQEDDTLTTQKEGSVSQEEMAIFEKFNPYGSIPTFVFGCRYYRVGNAYEKEKDAGKPKEEKEFRDLIEKMLSEK